MMSAADAVKPRMWMASVSSRGPWQALCLAQMALACRLRRLWILQWYSRRSSSLATSPAPRARNWQHHLYCLGHSRQPRGAFSCRRPGYSLRHGHSGHIGLSRPRSPPMGRSHDAAPRRVCSMSLRRASPVSWPQNRSASRPSPFHASSRSPCMRPGCKSMSRGPSCDSTGPVSVSRRCTVLVRDASSTCDICHSDQAASHPQSGNAHCSLPWWVHYTSSSCNETPPEPLCEGPPAAVGSPAPLNTEISCSLDNNPCSHLTGMLGFASTWSDLSLLFLCQRQSTTGPGVLSPILPANRDAHRASLWQSPRPQDKL